jgi:hypothetical protein
VNATVNIPTARRNFVVSTHALAQLSSFDALRCNKTSLRCLYRLLRSRKDRACVPSRTSPIAFAPQSSLRSHFKSSRRNQTLTQRTQHITPLSATYYSCG